MNQTAELSEYDFLAPRKIVFGWGRRAEAGSLARTLGNRAFLIAGSRTLQNSGILDEMAAVLDRAGVETVPLTTMTREPQVADVDDAARLLEQHKAKQGDLFLAIGGGSAIDLAKAVSAFVTNRQGDTICDYLEGVGRGLTLQHTPLPVLAMPTTGGTGTEATKNAVISNYDPPFKKSLRHELLVPRIVLIDPELSVTVPPDITASTGMDAITQLIESYISRKARPIPQALSLQGLELAIPAIAEAVEDGSSRKARENMAHAALLSGMALANSGLGLAHGVAAALGVHARVPHGLACAVMLPSAIRVNREMRHTELSRLAQIITGKPGSPDDAADFIQTLSERIGVPQRLSEIGVMADQLPGIVQSSRGSSLSGNPRELTDDELFQLLESLL